MPGCIWFLRGGLKAALVALFGQIGGSAAATLRTTRRSSFGTNFGRRPLRVSADGKACNINCAVGMTGFERDGIDGDEGIFLSLNGALLLAMVAVV